GAQGAVLSALLSGQPGVEPVSAQGQEVRLGQAKPPGALPGAGGGDGRGIAGRLGALLVQGRIAAVTGRPLTHTDGGKESSGRFATTPGGRTTSPSSFGGRVSPAPHANRPSLSPAEKWDLTLP